MHINKEMQQTGIVEVLNIKMNIWFDTRSK